MATVDAALSVLKVRRPDVAPLDFNLRGEPVTPVALLLDALLVPFVLMTAYFNGGRPRLEVFDNVDIVGKPYDPGAVKAAIGRALEASKIGASG